jgi:cyclic pyranopterin monophosphate synthase
MTDDDESSSPDGLSHLDARGAARMVDVGAKETSEREARASGRVRMEPATMSALTSGEAPKGDVLAVARVAGIQAAKKTPDLIPLCHALPLTACEVRFRPEPETSTLHVESTVRCSGKTGVEMEALVAVSVACLTIYDMLKAIDRAMTIDEVRLESKTGGKSGPYVRGAD